VKTTQINNPLISGRDMNVNAGPATLGITPAQLSLDAGAELLSAFGVK
jgi:hypothetical protein